MATEKSVTKIYLLLSPQQLKKGYSVLESFLVHKSANTISHETFDLTGRELNRNHYTLPQPVKEILVQFGEPAIEAFITGMKQTYRKQKGGIDYELYAGNALKRHLHGLFTRLKPFYPILKFYHHTRQDNGNPKTAPCSFSPYQPLPVFEVVEENKRLVLKTQITLNGSHYNLTDFHRYQFLLESNNEYFLLSYKDYQVIEWLKQQNPEQYSQDPEGLSHNILNYLEADYSVNRNNLFPQTEIEVIPVRRILLSELNNTFLMLTPQWMYDGFLVEGPWNETVETVRNGQSFTIKRNKNEEGSFLQLLESLHPNFPKQKNGYYYLSFADAQKKQWFLKAYHQLLDLNIELVGMDMLLHFRYSSFKAETKVTVKEQIKGRLTLHLQVFFGKEEVPLALLQKTLLAGQRAVLLKDSSLGIFSDEWLQLYGPILKHGKINGKEIEVARGMAISEQETAEGDQVLKPILKKDWWKKWHTWQEGVHIVYPVPATIKATLRPYQQKGFEWMVLLAEAGAGACLADDMGLGKTLQTICFLAHYIEEFPDSKNIIVCPSSLVYNWQQELAKFAPGISVAVYHGARRNDEDITGNSVQVIITSYGTVRAVDKELLFSPSYGVAVIDESHNIKNPSAQITQAVTLLNAAVKIALSGTPVVNNTFDLYAQLNFALPGMFGNREFFRREYADPIDRNRDEDKIKALQKLTAPFILRRTKEQVAKDLPDKTQTMLWCDMGNSQRELYDTIKDQIRGNIFTDIKTKGLNKSKLAVLQGILKLRQVCNSPYLLPPEERLDCTHSVKMKVLMGELNNILGNHKALIFSQFSSMLNLLAKECDKQGIAYYHFDGQTPPAKRTEMVNAFQEPGNTTHLFLISLKAGNTGLTLTAADYVFLFDPWWNTAVEQQAIDRTHRIGQTKNVFAYKIVCKDTIEEKIIDLQARKKQLAEDLIGEDDGFVKSLSEEDVDYLFS
jgi:SNF2 family DNA or RNA helicase